VLHHVDLLIPIRLILPHCTRTLLLLQRCNCDCGWRCVGSLVGESSHVAMQPPSFTLAPAFICPCLGIRACCTAQCEPGSGGDNQNG
jgi:hypothetical protein